MQPGKEQSLRLNVAVSGGSGTGTFTNEWTLVRRVRVIPTTESDTYVCQIKDADGHLIFDSNDSGGSLTGTLSMLNEMSLGIMRTVEITSASADGTYTIKLDLH
jgi:hypothetical protein